MGRWKPNKKGKYKVVPGLGNPCPRCHRYTEIREHTEITEKHLTQPFYYSRWFRCNNARCQVTQYMPEEFKVFKEKREILQEPEPFDDIALSILDAKE